MEYRGRTWFHGDRISDKKEGRSDMLRTAMEDEDRVVSCYDMMENVYAVYR